MPGKQLKTELVAAASVEILGPICNTSCPLSLLGIGSICSHSCPLALVVIVANTPSDDEEGQPVCACPA